MSEESYYELLQVQPTADLEIIQAAYRRLMLRYHPDRNHSPDAEDITKRLNLAFEILNDSKKRSDYDRKLSSQATANTQRAKEREDAIRRQAEQAAANARQVQEREDAMKREAERTVALSSHCPFCGSNKVRPVLNLGAEWEIKNALGRLQFGIHEKKFLTDSGRPPDELSAYECVQCRASWLDDGTILQQSNPPKGIGRVKKWFGG